MRLSSVFSGLIDALKAVKRVIERGQISFYGKIGLTAICCGLLEVITSVEHKVAFPGKFTV